MKILYFHQYFSTPAGSSGMRSYEFARALISRGHKVTMICGSYSGSKTGLEHLAYRNGKRSGLVDNMNVIEFELPYSNTISFVNRTIVFLKYALRCIRFALFFDYDLLFATTTPLTVGIPGIVMKLVRKKPFVFEVRDLWPELPKAMGVIKNKTVLLLMSLLEICSYKSADRCIGLSPGIVKGIQRYSKKPVELIPNGCDTDIFKPLEIKGRNCFPVDPSSFIALFIGTHGIANGLDAVLDAGKTLLKLGHHDIKLVMIGEGKLKSSLKQRTIEEKISNCIFMDSVSKREVGHVTASADVGMMILANVPAFYYGTSPNKFFDYIACGLPVINNYPGWIADMVCQNNCGLAVPPSDPFAFAKALIHLKENPEIRKAMGESSFKLSKKFARKELADKFVTFLEDTVNTR